MRIGREPRSTEHAQPPLTETTSKHMRVMLQGYLGIHTATHKEHAKN